MHYGNDLDLTLKNVNSKCIVQAQMFSACIFFNLCVVFGHLFLFFVNFKEFYDCIGRILS